MSCNSLYWCIVAHILMYDDHLIRKLKYDYRPCAFILFAWWLLCALRVDLDTTIITALHESSTSELSTHAHDDHYHYYWSISMHASNKCIPLTFFETHTFKVQVQIHRNLYNLVHALAIQPVQVYTTIIIMSRLLACKICDYAAQTSECDDHYHNILSRPELLTNWSQKKSCVRHIL